VHNCCAADCRKIEQRYSDNTDCGLLVNLARLWRAGNITATIVWNLIMARYPQMRWDYTGLVAATDPFGGHYDVLPPVWAAAHTTQFTRPGWKLLPLGQGSGWLKQGDSCICTAFPCDVWVCQWSDGAVYGWLKTNQSGGTYVGYSSGRGDLTIVVEKMDASKSACQRGGRSGGQINVTSAETAIFTLSTATAAALREGSLVVWRSYFGSEAAGTEQLFMRAPGEQASPVLLCRRPSLHDAHRVSRYMAYLTGIQGGVCMCI
jgi:hypothetical protein